MVNVQWSEAATLALISIWGHNKIQNSFDGTRRNGAIYGQIRSKLAELGFMFELCQVMNKCKYLKRQYLEAKDDQNKSGHGPTDWPFFTEMDEIFGDRPATNPTYVAGSSLDASSPSPSSGSNPRTRSRPSSTTIHVDTSKEEIDHSVTVNLDDSGIQEDDAIASTSTTAAVNSQKRKNAPENSLATKKSEGRKKKAKTNIIEQLTEVFTKSNQELQANIREDRRKAMEAKKEFEREKQERDDRRMIQMHELATERQMKMIETLGMLLRPNTPLTYQQHYPAQQGYWPTYRHQHPEPQHTQLPHPDQHHNQVQLPYSSQQQHHGQPQQQHHGQPQQQHHGQPQQQHHEQVQQQKQCHQPWN